MPGEESFPGKFIFLGSLLDLDHSPCQDDVRAPGVFRVQVLPVTVGTLCQGHCQGSPVVLLQEKTSDVDRVFVSCRRDYLQVVHRELQWRQVHVGDAG